MCKSAYSTLQSEPRVAATGRTGDSCSSTTKRFVDGSANSTPNASTFFGTPIYSERKAWVEANPKDPEAQAFGRIVASVSWAQKNFHTYPLMLFAFNRFDPSGGSIFPAIWSAMLAARSEGVGSSLTTVLGFKAADTLAALNVPGDCDFTMAACVPMGYPIGKWAVAQRNPVHTVAYRNGWGSPIGFEINEPLWRGH